MKSLLFFKALADITRIRIFHILLGNELSVNELVSLMDTGQSGISRHLKILADAGLLCCRRCGVRAFYSASTAAENEKFIETTRHLFKNEPLLKQDLVTVQQIIDGRRLETEQFFNDIAHKWDSLRREIIGSFDLNGTIIKRLLPCSVIADLGCGTGELLSQLTGKADKIIGVDSSPNMLGESRKKFNLNGNKGVDLRLGELEHLPLRDNEAEGAIISLALHHLSDPEAAVKEAARILKPKGLLIIAEFDKHDNQGFQQTYGDRWPGFSEEEISSWLTESGFITGDISRYNVRKALTINIYTSEKK